MRNKIITICFFCGILISATAFAVPTTLSHQGYVVDTNNSPVTGSVTTIFKLYSVPTGGSAQWTQSLSVTYDGGYYSVELGPGTPSLSADFFDGTTLYLGVTLEGSEEFLPRYKIHSVPYALKAGSVTGTVRAVGGLIVDNNELVDSSGNVDLSDRTVSLPQGELSDLPDPSESNSGQMYYATDLNALYYSTGSEWIAVAGGSSSSDLLIPVVLSISPEQIQPLQDTTITINGQDFEDGCFVEFGNLEPVLATFNNATEITATTGTELDSGVYSVKVTNTNNLRGILYDSLVVDGTPVWDTAEGELGFIVDATTGDHFTLEATDPEGQSLTFALLSGNIPEGLALNETSGVISGDPVDVVDDVLYEFVIRVSDTAPEPNTADRSFSILITHRLGQAPEAPGDSCSHILSTGSSMGDGTYWIDQDGDGGSDPFQVYCDMTHEGGGWIRVTQFAGNTNTNESYFQSIKWTHVLILAYQSGTYDGLVKLYQCNNTPVTGFGTDGSSPVRCQIDNSYNVRIGGPGGSCGGTKDGCFGIYAGDWYNPIYCNWNCANGAVTIWGFCHNNNCGYGSCSARCGYGNSTGGCSNPSCWGNYVYHMFVK